MKTVSNVRSSSFQTPVSVPCRRQGQRTHAHQTFQTGRLADVLPPASQFLVISSLYETLVGGRPLSLPGAGGRRRLVGTVSQKVYADQCEARTCRMRSNRLGRLCRTEDAAQGKLPLEMKYGALRSCCQRVLLEPALAEAAIGDYRVRKHPEVSSNWV